MFPRRDSTRSATNKHYNFSTPSLKAQAYLQFLLSKFYRLLIRYINQERITKSRFSGEQPLTEVLFVVSRFPSEKKVYLFMCGKHFGPCFNTISAIVGLTNVASDRNGLCHGINQFSGKPKRWKIKVTNQLKSYIEGMCIRATI